MYVYVCLSVEVLPLVEFFIDEDIEDKEVLSLLELEPVRDKDKFKETKSGRKITLSHVIWHDSFVWTEKLIETKNKNIYKLATCESFFFIWIESNRPSDSFSIRIFKSNRPYTTQAATQPNGLQATVLPVTGL